MHLLLFGAEMQKRWAKHPDAEARQRRTRVDARHLLAQDLGFGSRQTGTAIGLGPVGDGIALGDAALEPQPLRLVLELPVASAPAHIVIPAHRLPHPRRG